MKSTSVGLDLSSDRWSRWTRRLGAIGTLIISVVGALAQDLTVTTPASGFFSPNGVAVDSGGNAYIADTNNNVIRRVTFGGTVTTLAGALATPGFVNNVDPLQARFTGPRGIAINSAGTTLYVADTGNHAIRVITLNGLGGTVTNVTTLAGTGTLGSTNSGAASTFNGPRGVAVNPAGDTLYVTDTGNHIIRSIVIAGPTVSTVAGLALNPSYVNGDSSTSRFNTPWGIAVNSAGNALFVADTNNHVIRRIALGTVASTTYAGTGVAGFTNNPTGTLAQFSSPAGLAIDPSGNLFVGDSVNNALRFVSAAGAVTTSAGGTAGSANGTGSAAQFNGLTGVAVATVSAVQYVFIADTNNSLLRRASTVSVGGTPPTFASPNVTFNGLPGFVSFANPASGTGPITYSPTTAGVYSINPSTGTITGNPTSSANSLTFTVTASNGFLPNATQSVTINIGSVTGPVISTHPLSVPLTSGATSAFFNVFASGTPAVTGYQWERSINGTSGFTAIVDGTAGGITFNGATSPNLSINGVNPLMNGDQYRVVVTNGTPTTSNAATLSVPPVFTTVSNANFAVNQFSSFQIVATGIPAPVISLSSGAPPAGINFFPGGSTATAGTATLSGSHPNVTSASMTLTATNSGGAVTQPFNVNVVPPQPPTITSEASTTFIVNQPGSFTFQGFGAPSPTFTLSGSVPPGLQFISPVLSGTPINADNSPATFTVIASNSSGTSSPQTFTLTILGIPPTITLQPLNVTANTGGTASFTSAAVGTPTPTVRWQRQPSGTVGFVDLVESVNFSGTRTPTLTINNIEAFMGGDQYRMVATTGTNLTVNSIPATLTVNIGTTFTTFAGLPQFSGSNDGTGTSARFSGPSSIVTDLSGNVYIADTANHTVRKMTAAGVVTTLAGQPGAPGSVDGFGIAARFNSPQGVAVDTVGNVYVADTFNHTIRVIATSGNVTTLAGSPGISGAVDDAGSLARFFRPTGIVVDNTGTVYVADSANHVIRRVLFNGSVTTFAGAFGSAGFFDNPTGQFARFNTPNGLARDASGNIYVADSFNHTIRKITTSGSVTTFAGTANSPGINDGNLTTARFNRPYGVAVDLASNVYVADTFSHTLRKITPSSDTTTLAGLAGVSGSTDGVGGQARFNQPFGVAVDGTGNVYVADTQNHTIRRSGVPTPAQITTHPVNRTAGVGGTATFTVTASGAPNPGYQWQRQAVNSFGFTSLANDGTYSGVNSPTMTITNVTQVMSGDQFRVIVNNGVPPAVESSAATLTVGIAPVFTSPATANFQAQQAGTFTVVVTSTPAATFTATGLPSWATLNSTTGQIAGTPPDTNGSPFAVTITANNGIAATQALSLVVTAAPPTITTHPVSATVDQGQTASFSVAVGGTAPFTYQWRRNGGAIGGATGATLQLPNVQPSAQGVYSVSVSNAVGNVVSNGATLSVNSLPAIISQPGPQVALAGGSATFSVVATGGSINYQWRKNGAPVAGANSPTLTLNNVTAADAGNFDVQVSNGFGLVNSSLAQLTIVATPTAPIITAQPAARTVLVGGTTTLSIGATAAPAPGYQWRKNGSPISGANSQTYVLTNVQAGDAANYDVVVSNTVGSVTSSPAGVTVISRSFVGYYFGSFSSSLGDFSIYVREDNTGVFLGYLPGSNSPVMTLSLRVNDAGQFSFSQGAIAVGGTLNANGTLSGSILGSVNGTFGGDRAAEGGSQSIAGFYQAGANNGAGTAYVIAGPNNVAFAVVQTSAASDGGRGAVANTGGLTVTTNRSVITGTVTTSGILTGSSTGGVTMNFSGGSDAAIALQRLVNISSRARVAAGDAVAIAGFVISGQVSKPVLIRAVGPTLAAAPFNVPGALTTPRVELFSGTTSLVFNTGIAANRAAIDAAGQQAGAFPLGAAGTDAAILTTLPPGNYTAVVSSSTAAAGVVLVEVYDLSGAAAGQKLLNIATRAPAGVAENTLIAGFVVPPGTSKRVLIRGVGPGLTVFGVTGVLAQPVLSLISGGTTIAQNTNWTTSADAAVITSTSAQAGAFGLANNDSAMVVTLAPGNYTAQVVGVNGGTGVALIEVYEVP